MIIIIMIIIIIIIITIPIVIRMINDSANTNTTIAGEQGSDNDDEVRRAVFADGHRHFPSPEYS